MLAASPKHCCGLMLHEGQKKYLSSPRCGRGRAGGVTTVLSTHTNEFDSSDDLFSIHKIEEQEHVETVLRCDCQRQMFDSTFQNFKCPSFPSTNR